MNRNVESHFSQLPRAEIQRSKFDRSHSYKTSMNAGELIPFLVEEVLPGDTFDITTAKVVRSQTLLTPILDSIYYDSYYFFVPSRLVWDHWREFCGENTQSAWAPTVEYSMPVILPPEGGFATGTIADYMGLPVYESWTVDDDLAPSALPFRAYALICNEFFRDQNVSDPLLIPTDDANQQGVNTGNYISDVANGGKPFIAARYHDAFSSSLPAPQKGSPVGIPIEVPQFTGGTFPVTTNANTSKLATSFPLIFGTAYSSTNDVNNPTEISDFEYVTSIWNTGGPGYNSTVLANTANATTPVNYMTPLNLETVIPDQNNGDGNSVVSFNVNELRLAFAYQRFLESLSRSGSRYIEILDGLFNVTSPDGRLQRPEYLGGNRVPISISEVTNNAQSEQDFLGDLGAKSQTGDVHHDFIKSFTEHGYLIGVSCIRYDHSYSQGMRRFWTRKTFTDFYNPKFANLGEVPVYQAELYAHDNFTKDRVFGYQEAWYDYRYAPNMVTGTMRPGVPNSLAYWHLSDYYETAPTLSDGWIRESKANVDRVLAVTSDVADQFWCDIYIQNWCTRCMPMYSVPGLIDHF